LSFCCERCFQYPWLTDFVKSQSTKTGDCDYCGATNVAVVEPAVLSQYFRNAASGFRSLDAPGVLAPWEDAVVVGEQLDFLMQDRWQVFDDMFYDSGNAGELLEDIINASWDDDSGEPPFRSTDLFTSRLPNWTTSPADDWEGFSQLVRDQPDLEPELREMLGEDIWTKEVELSASTTLYRARLGWDPTSSDDAKKRYAGPDMGAPPATATPSGRANVQGEPVLYLAYEEATAIAEIRPSRGAIISIGESRVVRALKILNLATPIAQPNPFTADPLPYWIEFADLLNAFGWSLSKPLERSDDTRDYRAAQKLTAYVKRMGFDGISYPSALRPDGTNIVLFDVYAAIPIQSRLVRVSTVSVTYTELSGLAFG
jgi:RES domain-containing protein